MQAFRVYFVRVLQAFGDACKTVSAILGPIDDSMRVVNTNLDLLRPGFSAALQAAYQDATQVLAQYNFKGDDPSDLDIIRALAGVVGGPTAEAIAAVRASIQRVKDDIQSHLNAVNGLQDAGSYIASAASLLTATMGEVDDIKVASQTAQTAAERGRGSRRRSTRHGDRHAIQEPARADSEALRAGDRRCRKPQHHLLSSTSSCGGRPSRRLRLGRRRRRQDARDARRCDPDRQPGGPASRDAADASRRPGALPGGRESPSRRRGDRRSTARRHHRARLCRGPHGQGGPVSRIVARRLDAADPASAAFKDDLAGFREQLTVAIEDVTGGDDTPLTLIKQHRTKLSAFRSDHLDEDTTRLAEAMKQVTISDPVQNVIDQIDATQKAIDALNAQFAKGATTQIVPAIKFGAAVGKAVYGGSSSGSLAIGVLLAIKDAAVEGVQWVKDMQAKSKELDGDVDKIAELVGERIGAEQDVVVVSLVSSHLAILSGNVAAAEGAIAGIEAGLKDFRINATALSAIVERPQSGGFASVTAAMAKSWGDLQTRTNALLDFDRNQTLDPIETM